MKHVARAFIVIFLSLLAALLKWVPDNTLFNTLFTVNGIFFSIGYSVIISFDLSQVTNRFLLTPIKENLKKLETSFLVYFSIAVAAFLLAGKFPGPLQIREFALYLDTVNGVFSVFVLFYFVLNYRKLQKLKDEIGDKIRKENE